MSQPPTQTPPSGFGEPLTLTLAEALEAAPFTLGMSAGFFGFFAHTGVLAALEDEGLRPAAFAGSSAGALVGGAAAAGVPAEDLIEVLESVRREDFWDMRPGLGLLRGRRFEELLQTLYGVESFADCERPLVVSTWEVWGRRVRVLKDGELARAVHASCAFPGLLQPVRWQGSLLTDGGVGDRAGLAGVPAGTRVLHHHLSSRSPWRRKGSPALEAPAQEGLMALVIQGLPRVSPFKLEQGAHAFELAYQATQRALSAPAGALIRVTATQD